MPSKPATYRGSTAEAACQPRRRHDADTVDGLASARAGNSSWSRRTRRPVDRQAGVGDRRTGGVDGDGAQRPRRTPLDRALCVADDGDPVAQLIAVIRANSNAGTATPSARSSKTTCDGRAERERRRRPVEQPADERVAPAARRVRRRPARTAPRRRTRAGTIGAPPSTTARCPARSRD